MDQLQQQATGSTALILAECPECSLFKLVANQRTKLLTGGLRLAQLQETKTHFLNVSTFCQNIVSGTPFVTIMTAKGTSLLFPSVDQGLIGLFVPKVEQWEYFYTQLQNVVQLVPYEQAMQIAQFKETIELHCKDILANPLENDSNMTTVINKAGEQIKTGVVWLGGWLATGINKTGEYINSKITKTEEVKVSEERKDQIQTFKSKVNQTYNVTADFLKQLYTPVAEKTKEWTNELGQKIDSSDNKLQDIKQTKELTVATWGAAGTALTGVGKALGQVGDSISTNAKAIVQKKYGTDATKTYLGEVENKEEDNSQLQQPLLQKDNEEEVIKDEEQQQQQQQVQNPYPQIL